MARSGRPASESYQSVSSSVGQTLGSSEARILEDEHDQAPIFSLSKSSVDVVMATGSPQKRDPAWSRLNLKRSSSTNTHSDQNQMTLQQLHHHNWCHNSHQFSLTTQNEDLISPPPLSERWISNMHRWSGCSGSTHSRSSTPDTVVWKGGSSQPCSLNQDGPSSPPESPMSKLTSPPTTPSPFISPFHTPTLPPEDLTTSSSPLTLSTHQLPESSPHPWSTSTHEESSSEKLLFQFPSPVPSHFSLTDAEEHSDTGCLANDTMKELPSPGDNQVLQSEGAKSPESNSLFEGEETQIRSSGCHLELTRQVDQSCLMNQGWRSPLVSSLSESRLGEYATCSWVGTPKTPKLFQNKATMTSQLEMVDAAAQTVSPLGSCCDLRKDISTSNTGSHSFLGSPPGSRLNLKSPVGSHSNLVSASSSMFPVSSGEEEEKKQDKPEWGIDSGSSPHLERRRCLKLQLEEKNGQGRRSSMKQVQWDEDGLTWEIHGASLDPEELTTAIQKHIELRNSPKPLRRSSKKKKAPMPPLISNMVTTMDSDMSPPAMIIKCMVEGESEDTLAEDGGPVKQEAEGKKQEEEEVVPRKSRTDQDNAKEKVEEMHEEEVISTLKSPEHSKKKTKIRSLRRPGWCGSSRKTDD